MRDKKQKLSTASIALHWIVALTMIAQLVMGFYMTWTGNFTLRDLHKSVDVSISAFIILRVALRIRNGWPEPLTDSGPLATLAARVVHWILIISTLIMPISGALATWAGGNDVPLFGWELVSESQDVAGHRAPRNKPLHDALDVVHLAAGYVLIIAIVLHVGGALKHHVVDKDGTLRRMFGATVN